MGFWTKYFSTFLRGLGATSWKEKIEATRAVNALYRGLEDIKKARTDIEIHRVTRALKELRRALQRLEKSAEYADKFIFNAITVDKQLVRAMQDILERLIDLSKITGMNKTLLNRERELTLAILEGTKKYGDRLEREDYKYVEMILNLAKGGKDTFMSKIKQMFIKEGDVSKLFKIPMKKGVTREKIDIQNLIQIARDLDVLIHNFSLHKRKTEEELREGEGQLYLDTKKVAFALKDAFYQSYNIKKRDMILILRVLYDVHLVKEIIEKNVEQDNLPKAPTDKFKLKVLEIEEKILAQFHPVAQGFRIVIHAVEEIEKKAAVEATYFAELAARAPKT
ncbi:MAG: hypothetical protein AABX33_04990 [Nanoarchaeota archaeon]